MTISPIFFDAAAALSDLKLDRFDTSAIAAAREAFDREHGVNPDQIKSLTELASKTQFKLDNLDELEKRIKRAEQKRTYEQHRPQRSGDRHKPRREYLQQWEKDRAPREKRSGFHRKKNRDWSFIGVDGEGGGRDALDRQNYLLLRAGDQLIFNNNRPLSCEELLGFIADLDPEAGIYVAYYFNYDITMMLRDVSREVRPHPQVFTFWRGFLISWLPNKFISVCRAVWPHSEEKTQPTRLTEPVTINDVGPFFQMPFHAALLKWEIGSPGELEAIKRGKAARPHFELMDDTAIEYNRIECKLLEELMTRFREVCGETGYLPKQWQGPGWLATEMMRKNKVIRRIDYENRPDWTVDKKQFFNSAYYGGRFEITAPGDHRRKVFEYDINSAYPYAMRHLPCMLHGFWRKCGEGELSSIHGDGSTLYCAYVRFVYDSDCNVCDFPIRHKTGTIYYPRRGAGWYFSPEIVAAIGRGRASIELREVYAYDRTCQCRPFDYISEVYEVRKRIGKGNRGFSLKLGMNSHYGKICQSIGTMPYSNPVWGSLITSYVRAMLIDAYAQVPDSEVLMLATDGIYTTTKLDLPFGSELGQWEVKEHDDGMFFVQPGLYFYNDGGNPKTRGIPQVKVLQYERQFREAWSRYISAYRPDLFGSPTEFPEVPISLTAFVGYRLANARGDRTRAGRWDEVTRTVSFDWRSKRQGGIPAGTYVTTQARDGAKDLVTVPYKKRIGWTDESKLLFADQPDFYLFAPEVDI